MKYKTVFLCVRYFILVDGEGRQGPCAENMPRTPRSVNPALQDSNIRLHITDVLKGVNRPINSCGQTNVIKKVLPSKYCNISVTWVISMHQRAWCSFAFALLLPSGLWRKVNTNKRRVFISIGPRTVV